jgi:hypothetical protein
MIAVEIPRLVVAANADHLDWQCRETDWKRLDPIPMSTIECLGTRYRVSPRRPDARQQPCPHVYLSPVRTSLDYS